MGQKVWVLTRGVNDYNQDGDYFEAVWLKKPTIKQLTDYFYENGAKAQAIDVMAALAFVMHVEAGGGRRGSEDIWYHLTEVATRDT